MPDAERVRTMFGRIARRYDLLNRVLSAGTDQRWRREILRAAGDVRGRLVLDVCCGTGDVGLLLERNGARVLGVDFTREMLVRALAKRGQGRSLFLQGDALRLPIRDRRVDLATIAFGIRNVSDRRAGLVELARVVKPGGRVFVLEFSMPRGRLFGEVYRVYFRRVLPAIGGVVSGDAAAYRYLPDTVLSWPEPEEFQREMEAAGLVSCGFRRLSGGIAVLFHGHAPDAHPT